MEPTLVQFSGLPGTGKTALAHRLARRLQIPVISFDHFVDYSWPQRLLDAETLKDQEFWHILFSNAELQLSLGVSVIMDAVFYKQAGRDRAKNLCTQYQARYRPIYTYCSDEYLWQQRTQQPRENARPNDPPAGWQNALAAQKEFEPWPAGEALFVDAAKSLDSNLLAVVEYVMY